MIINVKRLYHFLVLSKTFLLFQCWYFDFQIDLTLQDHPCHHIKLESILIQDCGNIGTWHLFPSIAADFAIHWILHYLSENGIR